MLILLAVCAGTDLKYRKILDEVIALIGIWGLLFSRVSFIERAAGFLIPAAPLFILALWIRSIRGGDIKFLAVCGSYFGLNRLCVILCVTVILSIIYGVIFHKKSVPLAAAMLASVIIMTLFTLI